MRKSASQIRYSTAEIGLPLFSYRHRKAVRNFVISVTISIILITNIVIGLIHNAG
jgi:hypothetical protein